MKRYVVILRSAPAITASMCDEFRLDLDKKQYRFYDSFGTPEKKDDRDITTLFSLSDVSGVIPEERFSMAKSGGALTNMAEIVSHLFCQCF